MSQQGAAADQAMRPSESTDVCSCTRRHSPLWISQTGIGDRALVHLKSLTSLKILHLSQTAITNNGMKHLAAHPALNSLYINETEIDDAGLAQLVQCPQLRRIYAKSTRVTAQGVTQLRGKLPKCRVYLN